MINSPFSGKDTETGENLQNQAKIATGLESLQSQTKNTESMEGFPNQIKSTESLKGLRNQTKNTEDLENLQRQTENIESSKKSKNFGKSTKSFMKQQKINPFPPGQSQDNIKILEELTKETSKMDYVAVPANIPCQPPKVVPG